MNDRERRARRSASAFSEPGVRLAAQASMIRAPTIGNLAQTARFDRLRCHGRGDSMTASIAPWRRSADRSAGAGPRRAIARTSARNEPEMRMPRNSIVRTSLPIARTSSSSDELDRLPVARLGASRRQPALREPAAAMMPRDKRSTSCHGFVPHRSGFGRSLGETGVSPLTGVQHPSSPRRAGGSLTKSAGRTERTRPLAVRPFGRMLASYTVNEIGDSVGIVALAVLVYDRTGDVAPTAACSSPASSSPPHRAVADGAVGSGRRPPHAAVALRRRGARLRRARLDRDGGRSRSSLVLALALVDGAIAVTARALTRGAIASVLQPAPSAARGQRAAEHRLRGRRRRRLRARRPPDLASSGSRPRSARRCGLVPGDRGRARADARPAPAAGRAAGRRSSASQRPRLRPAETRACGSSWAASRSRSSSSR